MPTSSALLIAPAGDSHLLQVLTMREHLSGDVLDALVTYRSQAPDLAVSHRLMHDYYVNFGKASALFVKVHRDIDRECQSMHDRDIAQQYVEQEEMQRCIHALRAVMRGRAFNRLTEMPHLLTELHSRRRPDIVSLPDKAVSFSPHPLFPYRYLPRRLSCP